MKKKFYYIVAVIVLIVIVFYPGRHARYYEYIAISNILKEVVHFKNNSNQHNLKLCSAEHYETLLLGHGRDESDHTVFEKKYYTTPLPGGEYVPNQCEASFKVAVVVPYRDRPEQLRIFLNYMHDFLQKQRLWYRIFIADQTENLPFNRGKMLNIGAKEAIRLKFPCLILHDVDLLPLHLGNLYVCTAMPRHMSACVNTFRYNLPYTGLMGGAVAIQSEQFERINGMSNLFYGWGGEDDGFFKRLVSHDLQICRFPPDISRYMMLAHKKQPPGKDRYNILQGNSRHHHQDGVNSIPNNYTVVLEKLYTHLLIT